MFYVDKNAAASNLPECTRIMDKIVAEDPSYWPYGCTPEMFNGGIYMIRKSASHEPVGFTAWQEFDEGNKKIGYYSIGILPKYRNQGFAKEAVAKLINEKSANVDEVKAFIMSHNKPSMQLAKSLEVPVLVKNAMTARGILGRLAGGLAAAGGTDYMVHEGDYSHFNPSRVGNAVLNTILGAGGTHLMASGTGEGFMKGLGTLGLLPTKDLAFSAVGAMPKINALVDAAKNKIDTPTQPLLSDKDKLMLGGILGAGALGLTGAGLGITRALNKQQDKRDAGRVQLRLPTRDKNDQETVVDVPMDQANLPPLLLSKIMRDTRRKLREETNLRTWKRNEKNKLLSLPEPGEDEEENLEKAAFAYHRVKNAINAINVNKNMGSPFVNTMAKSPEQLTAENNAQNAQPPEPDPAVQENMDAMQASGAELEKAHKELYGNHQKLREEIAELKMTQKQLHSSMQNNNALHPLVVNKVNKIAEQANKLACALYSVNADLAFRIMPALIKKAHAGVILPPTSANNSKKNWNEQAAENNSQFLKTLPQDQTKWTDLQKRQHQTITSQTAQQNTSNEDLYKQWDPSKTNLPTQNTGSHYVPTSNDPNYAEWHKRMGNQYTPATSGITNWAFQTDQDINKSNQDAWNQRYTAKPKTVGDLLGNAAAYGTNWARRGSQFLTSPLRGATRDVMRGGAQLGAGFAPLGKDEKWYNPNLDRVSNLVNGVTNVGLGVAGAINPAAMGISYGGRMLFDRNNPSNNGAQNRNLQLVQNNTGTSVPVENNGPSDESIRQMIGSTPNWVDAKLQNLDSSWFAPTTPQQQYTQGLNPTTPGYGYNQKPTFMQQQLLQMNMGQPSMVGTGINWMTGGLINPNAPTPSSGGMPMRQ